MYICSSEFFFDSLYISDRWLSLTISTSLLFVKNFDLFRMTKHSVSLGLFKKVCPGLNFFRLEIERNVSVGL